MRWLVLSLVFAASACGSPSGMDEIRSSANPAPANEPDTEPLPPSPKTKRADPKVPLDAGHGK